MYAIRSYYVHLVLAQYLFPGRHDAIATVGDSFDQRLPGAAIEPDAVAQIGRPHDRIALGIGTMAGGTGNETCLPLLGFDRIDLPTRQPQHIGHHFLNAVLAQGIV